MGSILLKSHRVHVDVVKDQPVDKIGQPVGDAPRYADYDDSFPHGAQCIDHMDEIRVSRNQDEDADVGIRVGYLDAVGGHFDVDAVLYPCGAVVAGG